MRVNRTKGHLEEKIFSAAQKCWARISKDRGALIVYYDQRAESIKRDQAKRYRAEDEAPTATIGEPVPRPTDWLRVAWMSFCVRWSVTVWPWERVRASQRGKDNRYKPQVCHDVYAKVTFCMGIRMLIVCGVLALGKCSPLWT